MKSVSRLPGRVLMHSSVLTLLLPHGGSPGQLDWRGWLEAGRLHNQVAKTRVLSLDWRMPLSRIAALP